MECYDMGWVRIGSSENTASWQKCTSLGQTCTSVRRAEKKLRSRERDLAWATLYPYHRGPGIDS